MELVGFILLVANVVVLVGGGAFLRIYLPSYLSEKGKNLASKEDLQHLTRLVEGVRAEYAGELEQLKANLSSEGQVIERRRRVYEDVCASLRIFISGHDNSQTAKDAFHSAYAAAWLWASDSVLTPLNQFVGFQVQIANAPGSIEQVVLKSAYADVILAMREDVGFPSTGAAGSDYQFVQFGPGVGSTGTIPRL